MPLNATELGGQGMELKYLDDFVDKGWQHSAHVELELQAVPVAFIGREQIRRHFNMKKWQYRSQFCRQETTFRKADTSSRNVIAGNEFVCRISSHESRDTEIGASRDEI
ncbi:hypothetical protein AVEN_243234-1 [Araneus ventricosus]|uniref:Uncharacterized protein n=1 Tax=Araneus ventricosus TaxID=182803 RepID=A0A4Y2R779_ARAVE|nr:hypothetical protein AVEN_243234-1 [Araneus ventricosus]